MPRGYHHLTQDERCQIWGLKKSGLSQRDIGRELGRHHTTIRREMQRNSGGRGYRYKQAHNKATERRHRASSVPRKMTPALWQLVEEKLAAGWSPEQISGRLLLEGQVMVGRMRIYEYVRTDRKAGGSLYKLLRRRGKKPNWRGGRHAGRGRIPGRVDISERPAIVEQKSRIGDWEADTIVGAGQSGAVASVVDRASKMTRLARVDRKTAEEVGAALIRRLEGDRKHPGETAGVFELILGGAPLGSQFVCRRVSAGGRWPMRPDQSLEPPPSSRGVVRRAGSVACRQSGQAHRPARPVDRRC